MIKHMKIDENCSHSIARCPCKEPGKKTPEETDKAAAARLAFSRCEKRWEPNMEPKKLHSFNLFFPDTGWKILKSGFWTVIFSCLNSLCKSVDFFTFLAQTGRGAF